MIMTDFEKKIIKDVLDKLHENNIKFSAENFSELNPNEVFEYLDNPEKLEADCHGITITELRNYKENWGKHPLCNHIKSNGIRCKNIISGSRQIFDFRTWKFYHDNKFYCYIHNK